MAGLTVAGEDAGGRHVHQLSSAGDGNGGGVLGGRGEKRQGLHWCRPCLNQISPLPGAQIRQPPRRQRPLCDIVVPGAARGRRGWWQGHGRAMVGLGGVLASGACWRWGACDAPPLPQYPHNHQYSFLRRGSGSRSARVRARTRAAQAAGASSGKVCTGASLATTKSARARAGEAASGGARRAQARCGAATWR